MYIFINGFSVLALTLSASDSPSASCWQSPAPILGLPVQRLIILRPVAVAGSLDLSGMLITLFVVYRPNWVLTFDDSRYPGGEIRRYNFLPLCPLRRWLRWIAINGPDYNFMLALLISGQALTVGLSELRGQLQFLGRRCAGGMIGADKQRRRFLLPSPFASDGTICPGCARLRSPSARLGIRYSRFVSMCRCANR